MSESIYDTQIEIVDIDGKSLPFKKYKGKSLLIVNTASQCGYTPQLAQLENIYQELKNKNFEILAFPCNQFGNQEPGNNREIKSFCTLQYNVTFQVFSKIKVKGKDAHPLFLYLSDKLKGFLGTKEIKWNFTKFFVNAEGRPIARFAPNKSPEEIAKKISRYL